MYAVGTTISDSDSNGKSLHAVVDGVSGRVDESVLPTDWTSAATTLVCILTSDEYPVGAFIRSHSNPAGERIEYVQFVFPCPVYFFPRIGTFLRIRVSERQ